MTAPISRCRPQPAAGLTLPELLAAVAVLALLSGLAFGSGQRWLAEQRLEVASRRVLAGLERGREQAERRGQPCALALGEQGWHTPRSGGLPGCLDEELPLQEAVGGGALQLQHNLPAAVRFASNGLVLDGGTVLLAAAGTAVQRCVVVALPLGIARVGRWQEGSCVPR
jgi:prepilin-type N-terminal cleavage/methylation domain-containing protein